MSRITPMMKQYLDLKAKYKDYILFYRLGDFYEMFFDDALLCSKELEITLTGKSYGSEEKAPMCGVPHHAADGYLSKLIDKGYKVAICEQIEDPKTAKGIVKRDVVRIVTPGTNLDTRSLDETKNNYLCAVIHTTNLFGISIIDITTGDYYVTEVDTKRKLIDEIYKWSPTEIIYNDSFLISGVDIDGLVNQTGIILTPLEPWYFDDDQCIRSLKEHFRVESLDGLGLKDYTIGSIAAGCIMQYIIETQKNSLSHITKISPYSYDKYMVLDSSTLRNLELTETLREKKKKGSLLWVLDKTKTAMGARLLRSYMEQPLIDKGDINKRLDTVEVLKENMITREEIREYLNAIYDLERLMGKVSYNTANPRDLLAFRSSLEMLPHILFLIKNFDEGLFEEINKDIDPLTDIYELIDSAIVDEPPITITEGGIIKKGYNDQVDKLALSKTEGKTWLLELEDKERKATNIKNLKIKYNRVFGYHLEVTNSNLNLVPDRWERRQTLANAERYITPELKELEDIILGAEDKLSLIEYELFCDIRDKIGSNVERIQTTAKAIAKIDLYISLAQIAEENNFIRPKINTCGDISIKNGRHPVVEQMISYDMFVSNDIDLNNREKRLSIITGPNMAGKSTYMRQTALIVLMAQIGSFVPAEQADIGIVDRIFTRVGASDDLASGQSTFMVEMTEVANILRNATPNSLLILDEIGRGTSTFDGLSIAWAVIEHISNKKILGSKTLFATHFHELTELEGMLDGVNNYCIAVKEEGEDIVFLRKIVRGGADKSYGIQVAKIAGVPISVLDRAKEIAFDLEEQDIALKAKKTQGIKGRNNTDNRLVSKVSEYSEQSNQLSLFSISNNEDIIMEIRELDVTNLTPIDAINKLYKLQKRIKDRI